ncbi:hypothetical protein P8452_26305 [Trifolium repens]|nr:hypothetical protein P8452_26305 [Trifolium repens]
MMLASVSYQPSHLSQASSKLSKSVGGSCFGRNVKGTGNYDNDDDVFFYDEDAAYDCNIVNEVYWSTGNVLSCCCSI